MDNVKFQEAVDFLTHDERFRLILRELVVMREDAVSKVCKAVTIPELREAQADLRARTDFLDMFGVPTGEPVRKT